MGASLVLMNDTGDAWHCKVAADTKALLASYFIAAGFSTFAVLFGLVGFYAPVVIRMANKNVAPAMVAGIAFEKIVKASFYIEMSGFLASVLAGTTTFGIFAVRTAEASFVKHQFELIPPGDSHTFPMRPLRWREGTCTRVFELNKTTVRTETLSMKPIFSGLPHHNFTHRLSHWIQKHPPTHEDIMAIIGVMNQSNNSVSINVRINGDTLSHMSTLHVRADGEHIPTNTSAPLIANTFSAPVSVNSTV